MTIVKRRTAEKFYDGHKGETSLAAVWAQIPDELKARCTGRELGIIMSVINKAYHAGAASTHAEKIDNDAVYVDGYGIIELKPSTMKENRPVAMDVPIDGFHAALERFDIDGACGVCGDWKVESSPSSPALWIALYDGEPVVECVTNGDEKTKEQGGDIRRIMNITDRAFKGICDIAHGVFPKCRMSPLDRQMIQDNKKLQGR